MYVADLLAINKILEYMYIHTYYIFKSSLEKRLKIPFQTRALGPKE